MSHAKNDFHLVREATQLFYVGIPSVAVQFNLYIIFPIAASTVGRTLGTEDLAAFSLGTLVGSLTILSVIVGVLSAADTLMPRAYGSGHYQEMGSIAIRTFAIGVVIIAPLLLAMSQATVVTYMLTSLGQDAVVATKAAHWIQIYLLGAPANLLFRTIQRFCVAQHKPWPPVSASILPSCIMFRYLVHRCVVAFGVNGSAMAIVICQWMMCIMLLVQLRVGANAYEPASWPGLSIAYIRESLAWEPLQQTQHLSLGGVAALSEWWFWECMAFIAGTFGVAQLCAHSIAYNVIPLCFMLPLGLSIGLSVRMGAVLAHDPARAKLMAFWTLLLAAVMGACVGLTFYLHQVRIIGLFTSDPQVVAQCVAIWGRVCYYITVVYVFAINGAILRALGLQWRMAAVLGVVLWFIALPTILWVSVQQGKGLTSQWMLVPVFYTVLQVSLASCYVFYDWEGRSAEIRRMSGRQLSDLGSHEEQLSLVVGERIIV